MDILNPKKINKSSDFEQPSIFTWDSIIYILIPEQIFNNGYCVVYRMTGEIEATQKLVKGANIIDHSFAKGQYLISLSLGLNIVIDKVVVD